MATSTLDDLTNFPKGQFVSKKFTITDSATGQPTPVDNDFANWLVPEGQQFTPTFISVISNAAVTAGTILIQVTADGVEVDNGPSATLDTTNTLAYSGSARPQAVFIANPVQVGVSSIGTGATPITLDLEIELQGYLYGV